MVGLLNLDSYRRASLAVPCRVSGLVWQTSTFVKPYQEFTFPREQPTRSSFVHFVCVCVSIGIDGVGGQPCRVGELRPFRGLEVRNMKSDSDSHRCDSEY